MGAARNLSTLLTFFILLSSNLTNSTTLRVLDHDSDDFPNNFLLQEEFGYDFRSYPSYISPVEIDESDNSVQIKHWFSDNKTHVDASVTFNVLNFGAKGDGRNDDTKAFKSAWKSACSSKGNASFVAPKGRNFLLKPITFSGPCKSHIYMKIAGAMIASNNRADYSYDRRHWLIIQGVDNLLVGGGGTIDGNGNIWWKNSCKIDKSKPCKDAPTALTFYGCTNVALKHLKIQNAQQIHVSFEKCKNVQASRLVVYAPENSPNTDGIHITATQNIQISNCIIGTGDDCISIVNGSQKVQATDITCGPGHGISIGSLGAGNSEAYVSDVVVNRAKFSGTTNGVRIKTWQGGYGSANSIRFQNIEMQNVGNPIIIDQNYCDQDEPCKQQNSAVQISNVLYQNIKGTSASSVAINFDCSKAHPCRGIVLQSVSLVGANGGKSEAVCKNIHLQRFGTVSPHCP